MNATTISLTDDQLDRVPSAAELDQDAELARRIESRRPLGEFSPSNQDPWIQ